MEFPGRPRRGRLAADRIAPRRLCIRARGFHPPLNGADGRHLLWPPDHRPALGGTVIKHPDGCRSASRIMISTAKKHHATPASGSGHRPEGAEVAATNEFLRKRRAGLWRPRLLPYRRIPNSMTASSTADRNIALRGVVPAELRTPPAPVLAARCNRGSTLTASRPFSHSPPPQTRPDTSN